MRNFKFESDQIIKDYLEKYEDKYGVGLLESDLHKEYIILPSNRTITLAEIIQDIDEKIWK